MASTPMLTILDRSQVSPTPGVIGDKVLPLTYFDFIWLTQPPIHNLFFYELSATEPRFIQTLVTDLKRSLSTTLQYFYPFVGNLTVFPTPEKKPEIRYVQGDSVTVTFAECNLDFAELVGNHPRKCDMFYHLIPRLGDTVKASDCIKIPLFSVQVTVFPTQGVSIGLTNHHTLGDASTRFCFLKAWTSIARTGSNESFLATGSFPVYDRVGSNPKLEEGYLKFAKVETITEEYRPPRLTGPSDKLRATVILTRPVLTRLKKLVSTQHPSLAYVSSFTVACGYIWSCMSESRNDELQLFGFTIDCRARLDPPLPTTYFGNCVGGCMALAKAGSLTGKHGFVTAAKLLGESLHKTLTDTGGIVKEIESFGELFSDGMPTIMIGVAGTPKLRFYDMDFGWGNPKKVETVSIDYNGSISMNACRECNEDLEIGVCLSGTEMESFVRMFEIGLKTYI